MIVGARQMNQLEAMIASLMLAFMLASISTRAKADTWVTATVASYHSDRSTPHNELNYGLGFEHDVNWFKFKDSRFVGGFYKNSNWKQSTYVGLTYMPWTIGPAKVGAMFGVVTGYEEMKVMPTILPTVSFEGKTFGANIGLMPAWSDKGAGVIVGLQLKMKLDGR